MKKRTDISHLMAFAEKKRSGASLVEFAIVAPLLFLLIFGIIEFSRILMVQNTVTDGARFAAREASLATSRSAAAVIANAKTRIGPAVPGATINVVVTPASLTSMTSGQEVKVNVSVVYSQVSWVPSALFKISGTSLLKAEATMERE